MTVALAELLTGSLAADDDLEELIGYLTPVELERLAPTLGLESLGVASTKLTFREFIARVRPDIVFYRHIDVKVAVLQRVADRELTRVIIEEPPRHGKSEITSRLFPAYWLYLYPKEWVALASYGAKLAQTLARNARANYRSFAGDADTDVSNAVEMWETDEGGGMWATGVGGPATGFGFSLGIIDDSLKNMAEAKSETIAETNQDWYRSVWYTRRAPNAALIVQHTRWPGPADLIGWLLEQESGEEPENWHIVAFEAVKEDAPPEIPASCTIEPDWRAKDEALCPERYDERALRKIRTVLGEYIFSALYQQRPKPRDGNMFPRKHAHIIRPAQVPPGVRWVRYWDKAGSDNGGAYTAGVRMGMDKEGIVYVSNVKREQYSALSRRRLMRATAEADGTDVRIGIEQEPGSGGKDSAADDVRLLKGFSVRTATVTGDKETRAEPFAAQWQADNVRIVEAEWNKGYIDELEMFGVGGRFKDQTDASSGAYNMVAARSPIETLDPLYLS